MGFCSYSAIAWVAPLASGQVADVSYALPDTSKAGLVFGILNALGQIAFAYAGHNVVLEIQATLPSTPEKPSKGPMWRGCLVAYVVVAACYFPVAMVGYWAMRQCAPFFGQTCVAHCCCQAHGGCSCHWKLSGDSKLLLPVCFSSAEDQHVCFSLQLWTS
jgi:hypothetical protein